MADRVFLAVDLGRRSGRVLAGLFDGRTVRLEELHRFENGAVLAGGSLHWDLLSLWVQICTGLRAGGAKFGRQVKSIGIDSWGVDFGLLGRHDTLLSNPYSYRDRRTDGMFEQALTRVSREEIFAETGLQFMGSTRSTNSCDAAAEVAAAGCGGIVLDDAGPVPLDADRREGERVHQRHDHAVFQPDRAALGDRPAHKLDLPTHILGEIVQPGTAGPIAARSCRRYRAIGRGRVVVPARTTRPARSWPCRPRPRRARRRIGATSVPAPGR